MKKILITGAAGYLGSVLVERLLQPDLSEGTKYQFSERIEIVAIDNLTFNQTSLIPFARHKNFNFINIDVWKDFNEVKKWFEWADICFPLACYVGMPICSKIDERTVENVNYRQIKLMSMLNKHSKNKTKMIVPISNSGYGVTSEVSEDGSLKYCTEESPLNPISLYGVTKVKAERAMMEYCPEQSISLRLATVFGSSHRQRMDLLVNDFVEQALKNKCIVLFEKDNKRNYIHILDVIRTFIFCVNNFDKMKGQCFNVGLSSANLSKYELCQKIKEHIPELIILDAPTGKDPDKRNYIVSNEKLESLGWKPRYSLDDGIREMIEVCKTTMHIKERLGNI